MRERLYPHRCPSCGGTYHLLEEQVDTDFLCVGCNIPTMLIGNPPPPNQTTILLEKIQELEARMRLHTIGPNGK
jgi:hypothetical protein